MYDKIKCATGWVAVFGSFGYGVWAVIAVSDGPGRVEVPLSVAIPAMSLLIVLTVTSILMRLAQRLEQRIVNTLMSELFDLLVAAIDHKIKANSKHTRELIKDEVAAAVDEIKSQIFRTAMVSQATQAAANAAVAATVDVADATVMPMQSRNGRR